MVNGINTSDEVKKNNSLRKSMSKRPSQNHDLAFISTASIQVNEVNGHEIPQRSRNANNSTMNGILILAQINPAPGLNHLNEVLTFRRQPHAEAVAPNELQCSVTIGSIDLLV